MNTSGTTDTNDALPQSLLQEKHTKQWTRPNQLIKLQVSTLWDLWKWIYTLIPCHLNNSQIQTGLFVTKYNKRFKYTQMCNMLQRYVTLPVANELQGKVPRCWLRERQSDYSFRNAGIHVNTVSSEQSCRYTQGFSIRQSQASCLVMYCWESASQGVNTSDISEIPKEIWSMCIWYKSLKYQDTFS